MYFMLRLAAILGLSVLLAAALGPFSAGPARAHQTKLSSSTVELGPDGVATTLTLNARDLEVALELSQLDEKNGPADPERVIGAATAITGYASGRASVRTAAGEACAPRASAPTAKGDHVILAIDWRCPSVHGGLVYRVTLFREIDPAARHMVVFAGKDSGRMGLLGAGASEMPLAPARASFVRVFGQYLALGVEHIFLGYDHVAFILGVILWGRRLRPLVIVATAFTVAHTITLSLAVLDVFSLPSRWVEALIAASIVYVAAENFFIRTIDRRWRLTFLFGLVHGFGFAGALQSFGLPARAVAPALAAFNVGVEIGQIAILAIAVPAMLWLEGPAARRAGGAHPRKTRLVYAASGMLMVLGLYWLARRTII